MKALFGRFFGVLTVVALLTVASAAQEQLVTRIAINVFSQPDVTSRTAGRLEKGERVTATKQTRDGWTYINAPDRKVWGWILDVESVLEPQFRSRSTTGSSPAGKRWQDPPFYQATAQDATSVRGTPSSDGIIIGNLWKGDRLDVFAVRDGWYLVQGPDFTGWIRQETNQPERTQSQQRNVPKPLPAGTYISPQEGLGIQGEYVGYGPPVVNIFNDTSRICTVMVGGAKFVLQPGGTETINLTAGGYDYSGSVPGATPTSGRKLFEAGYHYNWRFYLSR